MDLTDAPQELSAAAAMAWGWAVAFLPRLATAILIIVAGFVLANWGARLVRRLVGATSHVDPTVQPLLGTIVRYAVLILFLVAALGQLGVQTASLLAVLGAAGLAIGLALQGTLQNIAAGIMLVYLRPFRVGDYIELPDFAGIVKEIGLFVTQLDTFDGLYYFVPNSEIWNKPLKNHSRNPRRLMTIQIGVSYAADPAEARRVLLAMAAEERRVLKDPAPYVYVESYDDSAVTLTFRAWAPTPLFWDVQRAMIEEAKRRLEAAGIEIPFPQRIVHMVSEPPPRAKGGPLPAADPEETRG
ncbi:mechanosensitive ion channel family protein [Propylenella binzhouense]|uniref:Small-conductance mechanosensitive channel n=1 Tax=Propylenella binzhouense TaxID=2555902 RepID=A0A964WVA4_9HYPH|nr:mechanosensitive ion channel family protein [Propylenella binzhouense]MYZ49971.1 mechanosensitive ion channel family protein [Propylenella binzhouense]